MTTASRPVPVDRLELDDGSGASAGRLRFRAQAVAIVAVGGACGVAGVVGFVAVAGLAAVLAGVLVLARPQYAGHVAIGLVLSNAPVVLLREHGLPGAVAFLVPLLLAVSLGHRTFVRREPLVLPHAVVWAVALLVVQIVSALASRDPQRSVTAVQGFLVEGFLLFVLVVNVLRDREAVRTAVLVVVVVSGLLGSLSLVKEVSGDHGNDFGGFASMSAAVIGAGDGDGDGSPRHAGPIGEQNRWAQTLAMVLPLAIALMTTESSRSRRYAATAATVGIAAGIVFTYSRGAAVGLALTGLVATAVRWVRPRTALVVAVATVATMSVVAPTFAARTTTILGAWSSIAGEEESPVVEGDGPDGSISNRAVEGQAALNVFTRHPVIGVGPDLFSSYFQDEARAEGADRIVGVERQAHTLYLGLAAETGVTGLVAFIGVVAAIIVPLAALRRRTLAARRDVAGLATGAALAVVTYLTTGLFLHASYIRFFWLIAALATALGVAAEPPRPRRPHDDDDHHHDDHHHHDHHHGAPLGYGAQQHL